MKRVSIYNEKGGVGKTTVTVLLPSYLAYSCGKRVCVLDFDYPSFHLSGLRRREEQTLQDPRSPLALWKQSHPTPGEPYELYCPAQGR